MTSESPQVLRNPRAKHGFRGRTCSITSVGSYVPERVLTADLEKMVETTDDWITTRTGIKERRIASAEEFTSDMASKAALRAMEAGGVKPEQIDLIVTDFDGVITDNRVWTDEYGKETVVDSRSDSMHLRELRERGIDVVILSSEPNPVVTARAAKMGDVEAVHGIDIRGTGVAFKELLARKHVDAARVAYIGNDLNDLPCFALAGWSVAVADAYPEVVKQADYVLQKAGGHGALREVCDMILARLRNREASDRETER